MSPLTRSYATRRDRTRIQNTHPYTEQLPSRRICRFSNPMGMNSTAPALAYPLPPDVEDVTTWTPYKVTVSASTSSLHIEGKQHPGKGMGGGQPHHPVKRRSQNFQVSPGLPYGERPGFQDSCLCCGGLVYQASITLPHCLRPCEHGPCEQGVEIQPSLNSLLQSLPRCGSEA